MYVYVWPLGIWWYQFVLRSFGGKFCQRTTKQHPSILYRPNEMQKLDRPIFGSSLCSQKNDSLYYSCNVISLATLAHWVHGIDEKSRESRSRNFQASTATNFRKIVGAQRFHVLFCLKMSPRRKKTAKQSKVARKLRFVAKIARLQENAKVAQKLRCATSQFSGGTEQCFLVKCK